MNSEDLAYPFTIDAGTIRALSPFELTGISRQPVRDRGG